MDGGENTGDSIAHKVVARRRALYTTFRDVYDVGISVISYPLDYL